MLFRSWDELFKHPWITTNLHLINENALIENPLAYDLLETQQRQIPKDHTNTCASARPVKEPKKPILTIGSALIRNYSAGALNGLSQTPQILTNLTQQPKLSIQYPDTTITHSVGIDNSYPGITTTTTPKIPITTSTATTSTATTSTTTTTTTANIIPNIHPLDTSIQEDFENIIQEYNIIPTGCDSFESDSSFALATTMPNTAEIAKHTQSQYTQTTPIPIPRFTKHKSDSYDNDFIAMQRELKFVTPPDNTYTSDTQSSGLSKFWTSGFRILKDSLRDSYDYLSSNPKSL